jgi:hypothetical protein
MIYICTRINVPIWWTEGWTTRSLTLALMPSSTAITPNRACQSMSRAQLRKHSPCLISGFFSIPPALVVVVLGCRSPKTDIPCTTRADCTSDLPCCDGRVTQCSQSVCAVTDRVCRQDQLGTMLHQSCTSIFDCKSNALSCFASSPDSNCPTCSQPVPGCATGTGYCDIFQCLFETVSTAAPSSTCSVGGPCGALYFCKDHCPANGDGAVDEGDSGGD